MGIIYTVPTMTTGVYTRCDKFVGVVNAGFGVKWPWDSVHCVSNQLKRLTNSTNTKTKDDVTVTLTTAIIYRVEAENSSEAFYNLPRPEAVMNSYADNCIRGYVPSLTLEQLFSAREELRRILLESIAKVMHTNGYTITDCLLEDIVLPPNIAAAMNERNRSLLLRVAAENEGDANKIRTIKQAEADAQRVVKAAEAEAEAMRLKGTGIARQRIEVVQGLKASMAALGQGTGVSADDAMRYTMAAQYLETLQHIGGNSRATVMIPYAAQPGDMLRQMMMGSQMNEMKRD
jgi:regulator of protease activity HflC (stomatin/prohibitin superfamily)